MQVPIRVLYLDRSVDSGDPTAVNHHDFVPEALSSGGQDLGAQGRLLQGC